jgi:hypothetical protein
MKVNETQKTTSDVEVIVDNIISGKKKTFGQVFFIVQSLFWMINGFLYLSANGNDERVFSRFFLSILCYGIYEILRAITSQNSR